jgi:4-hydroxybenzoate polyprenyltransferase
VTRGLARACHPLPTVAVTVLAALLVVAAGGSWGRGVLVVAAVAAGQLVIGWSNDLVDAGRDRAAGRRDKPLASGEVGEPVVRAALGAAVLLTVVLSLLTGWVPGAVHLVLVVGSGVAYNLGLKGTVWSWLPYAVAFGSLPAVAWAGVGQGLPPPWVLAVGALLGVGAHLLNVLPDLAEDERAGIRGLPHRLGARWTRRLAPVLLLAGAAVVAWGPAGSAPLWAWLVLGGGGGLAVLAWTGPGRVPFLASLGMALLNVMALVLRS